MADDAKKILASLRYEEDSLIVNPFGERAFLKREVAPNGDRFLTECCFPDSDEGACERHAQLLLPKPDRNAN